jgi:hypothetical protein
MKVAGFITLMIAVLITSPAISAEWVKIPGTDYQIDNSNIKTDEAGNTRFWEKYIWTKKNIKNLNYRFYDKYIDYSDFSYTVSHSEINCIDRTERVKIIHHHDREGILIVSTEFLDMEYRPIVPGSDGAAILAAVCRKKIR